MMKIAILEKNKMLIYDCSPDVKFCTECPNLIYDKCVFFNNPKFKTFFKNMQTCDCCGEGLDIKFSYIIWAFRKFLPENLQFKCCACFHND